MTPSELRTLLATGENRMRERMAEERMQYLIKEKQRETAWKHKRMRKEDAE